MRRRLTAHLRHQFQKKRISALRLWYINFLLRFLVPFNAPHGYALRAFDSKKVEVRLPFRRVNRNHLGGIHACAIATVAEMSSGLLLLQEIDLSEFRLIMKSMKINYEKQGRGELVAQCFKPELLEAKSLQDLLGPTGECVIQLDSEVLDERGERIALAEIQWQLKSWEAVRG